jgi:HNH endonuclease/AP2 domain
MQQIPLSQGQFALVDDAAYPLLSEFRWCYRAERDGRQGYAVRNTKVGGKRRQCYLHRQLMQPGEGQEVIFLNHDRLDCRRENLRVVSKEDARRHHRVRRDSKSGVKGVRYNAGTDSWSAYVHRHGHAYHVGTYFSREQAVAAYEQALRRENPDLHTAPRAVERPGNPGPVRRENPDAACPSEGR